MEEAWTLTAHAYELDPKDELYQKRYQKLSTWAAERDKQLVVQSIAKNVAEDSLAKPTPFESLTLRQRLYLSALLRCCASEDQKQILSIDETGGKLAASLDHIERVLRHLWHSGLIVVDPSSRPGSYVVSDKGSLSVYLTKVRWTLNVASTQGLSQSAIVGRLRDPDLVPDDEIEQAIELWREVALEESLEYLQHKRRSVNLYAEIGDKTREAFNELLNWFSTSQIYAIVWSIVPKALADHEAGKFTSRPHAANSIPGRCKSYGERAHVMKWNLSRYRRDFECEQSILSQVLFDRYLMIGQLGFDNRPGDFSSARLATKLDDASQSETQSSNTSA